MSTKIKIIILCCITIVLGVCLFWIQKQNSELAKLKAQNSELIEQKKLTDGTVRSSAQYASKKDIETLIKDLGIDLNDLKKDIGANDSEINGLQDVVIQSQGYNIKDLGSMAKNPGKNLDGSLVTSPEVKCSSGQVLKCPDQFGYLTNRQQIKVNEKFNQINIPIADVGFSSWKDKPWDVNVYSRNYNVVTVLTLNENGRNTVYNKVIVDSNNKKYTLPVKSSEFIQIYPKAKFRFNPRLYLGVDAGLVVGTRYGLLPESQGEIMPNIQLAMFTYGMTKLDTEWSFLGLGIGYAALNQNIALVLSPVNYNVGKPIPFIENLFLGPTISFDTNGQFGVLLGLRVGL